MVIIMSQELTIPTETEAPEYGPKMSALAPLQRRLVEVYLEHPTWSATAMALEAGYAQSSAAVRGSINLRDPRVIEAINEEGSRRLRAGGPLAVMGLMKMVVNEAHKDHFRACVAVADRTGFHALSEHKVTVDDKRPQTKRELIDAVKNIAAELKLSPAMIAELTGEKVIEAEFSELSEDCTDADVDADIAAQMEDL